MDLKYDDIHTFLEVYKAGTFTKASRSLGITQSALSQKVSRLEEVLNATLFIRLPRSLELTSSGEKLLIYARQCVQLQDDFLNNFDQYSEELSGVIRIAGFSSVMRSVVIPALSNFITENPKVSIEFSSHEMGELEEMLLKSQADFIITDYFLNKTNTDEIQFFEEEYVEIFSKKSKNKRIYLDHSSIDNATSSFFDFQKIKMTYERRYMGDVYSMIDGVSLGLGRAIMSKHLVLNDRKFSVVKHKKKYIRPVVLSRLKQKYHSPLHSRVYEILTEDHLC